MPFFDHDDVFQTYKEHRERTDNPNDTIERPIFLELAGRLEGLDIVDLGCGDACFGRDALEQGARSYLGVEVAGKMVELARANLEGSVGSLRQMPIESWRAESGMADLVSSRLALNYVADLIPVFREIVTALRPEGRAIFSVEHPLITSSFQSLGGGGRTSWVVDDYFRNGRRPHSWMGREVVKYHRTIDDYYELLESAGLRLERLREAKPVRANFQDQAEYERRLRIPLFLFIVARRAESPDRMPNR